LRLPFALFAWPLLFVGCGHSASGTPPGSALDDQPASDPSVYQHHRNGSRDGLYIDPVFTQAAAKSTHVLAGFMGTVTTNVNAQPLYVENGPGGAEAFVVATENNHVTTYDATTGAILWDQGPATYGQPANGEALAHLSCGTVNPLGITGTPYIDIGSRTLFFDAMTTPDDNVSFHHLVYAVKLDDGTVLPGWPVDVDVTVPDFQSLFQNQRGALQFVNGVLYVPYGGLNGDCGSYHGWVIGFPVARPQTPTGWRTMASKGGIWGTGALPTDGTSIFPVTGNTEGTNGTWGGGEAVIRLGAGPTFSGRSADYYYPALWESLDANDLDLGGASEVLLDMPAAQVPHLVAVGGKDGNLYLLNRDNLGGKAAELLMTPVANNEIKGAPAAYTTAQGTYVAFHVEGGSGTACPAGQGGNLVVVQITQSPMAAKTAWCSTQADLASPMVTTTDGTSEAIVWNADERLYGWDGDTGAVVVDGSMTKMSTAIQGWNTPIDAKGRMAVGVNGQLYVFTP
jgi:hypothetical protein